MLEVEIENFQSIEKADFKVEGFTAFVGRSNIGKSAAVRAIQCVLTGASGTNFVRHGASCERRLKGNKKCKCQTRVKLKTPEMSIVWEKGDAVNRYTVTKGGEPVVYDNPGVGTPDFLKPDFEAVRVGDSDEVLQVSEQFSPIFLLNQSGPAVADVLSDVAKLDDINRAMRLVSKDRKEAVSTRNVREKDAKKLREELTAFEGLDGVASKQASLEQRQEVLENLQIRLKRLTALAVSFDGLVLVVSSLTPVVKVRDPDSGPVSTASERLGAASRFLAGIQSKAPIVKGLMGVEKLVIPDGSTVVEVSEKALRVDAWLSQAVEAKSRQAALSGVVKCSVPDVSLVSEAVRRAVLAARLSERLSALSGTATAVPSLALPDAAPLGTALAALGRALRLESRLQSCASAKASLEAGYEAAAAEEAVLLQEFQELGVCPTCSQRIDSDHTHLKAS